MARKFLTAITEMEARRLAIEGMVAYHFTRQQTALLLAEREQKFVLEYGALKFVNVQRLMSFMRAIEAMRLLPMLTPKEHLGVIERTERPLFEEEEYVLRGIIPQTILERERTIRREKVRLEKRLAEVRERLLSPTAINFTDQEEFALMEKYLWTNLRTETQQIMEKLLLMTIAKQYWCELVPDLEALTKLMLQMYVTMFMGMPRMLNMIALRLSAITKQWLYGLNACMYLQFAEQGQAIRSKAWLMAVQRRKLITKAVASAKRRKEWVPRKEEVGVTEELKGTTPVSTGKDFFGKDMFFLALRYAYGMPYWLRRWIARSFGMPENHKFARYFGIGCIPIRRGLWGWRRQRYTVESFTYFNRDMYIKLMKKYGSRYRTGYRR